MSDHYFDALRSAGEYPPKGWGWLDAHVQRNRLVERFAMTHREIEPWMRREAERLGVEIPESTANASYAESDTNG